MYFYQVINITLEGQQDSVCITEVISKRFKSKKAFKFQGHKFSFPIPTSFLFKKILHLVNINMNMLKLSNSFKLVKEKGSERARKTN